MSAGFKKSLTLQVSYHKKDDKSAVCCSVILSAIDCLIGATGLLD